MFGILIAIHVVACLFLIVVILLQAGRGGSLAETFGGGGGFQTIFGTKTSTFLTRATAIFAVIFLVTSLSLAVLSAKRGKSLMEGKVLTEEKAKLPEGKPPAQPITEENKQTPQPIPSGEQTPQ